MRKIKLVIFDLDGTLVNAYPAITRSFNYTMRKLSYPRQGALTIRRAVGWGDANLLKPFVNPKDLKKALSLYRRHHRTALAEHSCLFPGVDSLLSQLRNRGYRLAIASNRPTKFSRILFHHLKLDRHFEYLLCGDKLEHGKPHPEILNKIMQRFSLHPNQTLYVGDMAIDAQAGRRAKVRTIIVTTGSSSRQEIIKEKPHCIIEKITDLLKVL